MKLTFAILLQICIQVSALAQNTFQSNSGTVRFFSKATIENIEATNKEVICLLDISKGDVFVKMSIPKFNFENSFMQEHFNEKYLESDKYPNATFKGRILDFAHVDLSKDATYNVMVEGDLTIHGVVQKRQIACTLSRKGDQISVDSKFNVKVADHKIEIPQLMFEKIAETIEVFLNSTMVLRR